VDRSFHGFLSAVSAFADHAGSVDLRFLWMALPLQVANLVLRAVAWRNLLAAAFPASTVRLRDVFGATTAGDAINVVAPVRVGDVATIALAHGKIDGSNVPAITSSLVVFGAFDFVVSLGMYAWVYTLGVFPALPDLPRAPAFEWSLFASNWWPYLAVGACLVLGVLLLRAWLTRRVRDVWRRAEEGVEMLRQPRRYVRSVAFPQALAVVLRLGVVMLSLRAFHLPSTLRNAVIVTAVGSITTIMPLTPNGAGARQAVLAYALRNTASAANVLTFSVGQQLFVSLVNGTIGLASLMWMVRTLRPSRLRKATRRVRSPFAGPDP
jgi:glycosyltransferase 2 family protein